jgi:hypothetical protein
MIDLRLSSNIGLTMKKSADHSYNFDYVGALVMVLLTGIFHHKHIFIVEN